MQCCLRAWSWERNLWPRTTYGDGSRWTLCHPSLLTWCSLASAQTCGVCPACSRYTTTGGTCIAFLLQAQTTRCIRHGMLSVSSVADTWWGAAVSGGLHSPYQHGLAMNACFMLCRSSGCCTTRPWQKQLMTSSASRSCLTSASSMPRS